MGFGLLGYNDSIQNSAIWASPGVRSATLAVAGGGTTTSTLPLTNIFTRAPSQYWELTGIGPLPTVQLNVQLRTSFGTTIAERRARVGLMGLVGLRAFSALLNCQLDLKVRLRTSSTSFVAALSSPLVDKQRTLYQRDFQGSMPAQLWFPYIDSNGYNDAWKDQGGLPVHEFNVFEFSLESPGSPVDGYTWTLQLGRLVAMSAFAAGMERYPNMDFASESEVVKAFNGQPYVMKKPELRRRAGKLYKLNDTQVYGRASLEPGASSAAQASLLNINRTTGRLGEACAILELPTETATSGRYSSRWQSEPVFGLLSNALNTKRVETTQTGGLYDADFEVTEIPL